MIPFSLFSLIFWVPLFGIVVIVFAVLEFFLRQVDHFKNYYVYNMKGYVVTTEKIVNDIGRRGETTDFLSRNNIVIDKPAHNNLEFLGNYLRSFSLFRFTTSLVVSAVLAYMLCIWFGIDHQTLLISTGILGAAFGATILILMSNFFYSYQILWRGLIKPGDYIHINGFEGTIKDINASHVLLNSPSKGRPRWTFVPTVSLYNYIFQVETK